MKKGICIHYLAHRGIGKIVKEEDDWKKTDKQFKQQVFSDIYCHGCGPDMKTATKNYNIDMEKKKKEAKERKKLRNSKKVKIVKRVKRVKNQIKKAKKRIILGVIG